MYRVAYLENYSDDTLLLVEYLVQKQTEEISLAEIFSDIGLDELNGDFKDTDVALEVTLSEDFDVEFHYAIDLVIYLAALLLECQQSGSMDLADLADELEGPRLLRITATPEEHEMLNRALQAFVGASADYDISEMMSEEELAEMAAAAEEIRQALYES